MTLMAITPIDKELLKLISQLNNEQKTSLMNFIKPFMLSNDLTGRQTLDEYNIELENAIENVKKGNFTTLEDLEKEMESW